MRLIRPATMSPVRAIAALVSLLVTARFCKQQAASAACFRLPDINMRRSPSRLRGIPMMLFLRPWFTARLPSAAAASLLPLSEPLSSTFTSPSSTPSVLPTATLTWEQPRGGKPKRQHER